MSTSAWYLHRVHCVAEYAAYQLGASMLAALRGAARGVATCREGRWPYSSCQSGVAVARRFARGFTCRRNQSSNRAHHVARRACYSCRWPYQMAKRRARPTSMAALCLLFT